MGNPREGSSPFARTILRFSLQQSATITSMKKVFHWINTVLSVLLALLAVGMLLNLPQTEDGIDAVALLPAVLQLIMALIVFFVGVLLPENPKRMSRGMRTFLKILMAIAIFGEGSPSSVAAYNVIDSDPPFRRYWEPSFPLVWFGFEAVFLFFMPKENTYFALAIISMACLVALYFGTFVWNIFNHKERGTLTWVPVVLPSLIILLMFGVCFAAVVIQERIEGPALTERLSLVQEDIEDTLNSYEEGTAETSSSSESSYDYSNLTMDDIVALIQEDNTEDVYYRWTSSEDNAYALVTWTDGSDEVIIYQFVKNGDTYSFQNAFVSPSMTTEDVAGKQEGIIPAS